MWTQCNTSLIDKGDAAVTVEQPLFGDTTFHTLGLWIAAGFGLFASSIAFILIFLHATHYSNPDQQRQIIRILLMIPIYCLISFLSYLFYKYFLYWEVVRDCYEAFAIASFFNLLCFYTRPNLSAQKAYFRTVEPRNWVLPINWLQPCTGGAKEGFLRTPRSGLTWFNIIYIGVFQYCFIRVFFTFVSLIAELTKRYCDSSLSPAFAHVWVLTFDSIAVTIAMYCLIQFYVQMRIELAKFKPFMKVLCIKLVIFFSFWQNTLISFLSSGSHAIITTGPRVSYVDVQVGIPSVLLCVEMAMFSILHIFAFPYKPYDNGDFHGGPLGLKALLDAFSPMDFIKATARGFRWLFVGIRYRTQDPSYDDKLGRSTSGGIGAGAAARQGVSKLDPEDDTEYGGPGGLYKPQAVGGIYGAGGPSAQGSAYEMQLRPPNRMGSGDDANSDKLALLEHQQSLGGADMQHVNASGASTPRPLHQQSQTYGASPALRPYGPPQLDTPANWPLAGESELMDDSRIYHQPRTQQVPYPTSPLPGSSSSPPRKPPGTASHGAGYDPSNRF